MTNEQKAKELSINVMADRHFESNGVCQRKQIENALMEMADWKDKNFSIERKQMIEKANQAVTQSFENGAIFIKKQEMIELYKQDENSNQDSRQVKRSELIRLVRNKMEQYESQLSKQSDNISCDDVDWMGLSSDMFSLLQTIQKSL